jgi:hypothetical protein
MQPVVDRFYNVRKGIIDRITYSSIRFYGIECTLQEVKDRRYKVEQSSKLNLSNAKDLDVLLTTAKERHKDAMERRAFVTDKVKTLITFNSAFLAVIAAFLPKAILFDSLLPKIPLYIAVLSLLDAFIVLWSYFEINAETTVSIDQEDVSLDSNDLKKALIGSYLEAQRQTDNVTNFLADLYKTARFFLLGGLLVIFGILSLSYFGQSPSNDAETLIKRLRGEPKLIELLRGPKGDRGDKGESGEKGPPGEKGERGPAPDGSPGSGVR